MALPLPSPQAVEFFVYCFLGGGLVAAVLTGGMYDLLLFAYLLGKGCLALLEMNVLVW